MKRFSQNDLIKKYGSTKSRFFYTIVLIFLTFNLLLISSYAWLTLNRNLNADNIDMSLAVDDTTAIYEAYMYDIKSGKGVNLVEEGGDALNISNLVLNQYDTIFRKQNKNTPAFAKIVITRNESMQKSGIVSFTIDRESDNQTSEVLTDFSSSIIRFTLFTIDDKSDVAVTDPNELYFLINTIERFNEIEKYSGNDRDFSKTFVHTIGEGEHHIHEKDNSITLSLEYSEQNWYIDSNDGNEKINIYLYITYDVQLIECYMHDHEGGSISLEDTSFMFKNDLKKIKASYVAIS